MIALTASATLALAACGGPADDTATDAEPAETPMPVEPGSGIGDGAPPLEVDASSPDSAANSIPIAIRGRWGLVPADCTSTSGDAKGLIEVSKRQIRFYESVGTLGEIKARAPGSIRANWSFVGEGMEWSREMALTVQNGGNKLERREYGEDAMQGVLTYTRCDRGADS